MKEITIISTMILAMIYNFTAHTINCVCHMIKSMFRVLGMYNFDTNLDLGSLGTQKFVMI